jgi:ABC-type transport system involved in multi-copper enzyme maturation permease subunit
MAGAVYKEFRALLPIWVACAITIGLGVVPSLRSIEAVTVQVLAYVFGTIALGAQSIGHEYGYRTLGLQLSQPIERRHLLIMKLSVLLPMMVTLASLMWWALLARPMPSTAFQVVVVLVPALAGLLLAPYVTMLSRSQLAGTVLTLGVLGIVWLLADIWAIPGAPLIITVCAAGGILSWRTFMRLEAIDGAGAALNLPGWWRRARTRHRHPLVQLVKKELHIQQLTFAIVGIYLVAWAGLAGAQHRFLDLPNLPIAHLTLLYTALICLLIGSLASAEERQFGTLQWQTLLPVPRWQQWSTKVGVTMALTVLLGVGLPLLLMRVSPSPDDKTLAVQMPLLTVALIVSVTVSLYVSSVSASGVRALVVAVPSVLGLFVFVRVIAAAIRMTVPSLGPSGRHLFRGPLWFYNYIGVIALVGVGALILLVLRFAAINHTLADRSIRRISQQLAWVAGALIFALALLTLVA